MRKVIQLFGVDARALPKAIAAQHEMEVLPSIHALVDRAAAGPRAGVDGAIEALPSALLLGPAAGDVAAVCRQVRSVRGPFELPIVALVETRADLARALDAGANDAAAAPWDDEEIAARLSRGIALVELAASRVEAERARARSVERVEAEIEALIDAAPIGVALLDRDLRYLRANRAIYEAKGLPMSDARGRDLGTVDPRPSPELERIFRLVLDEGEPHQNELVRWPGRDGAPDRHYLASYFPVRSGGRVEGIATILVDMTDRAREETARAILARCGEALATPLDTTARIEAVTRLGLPELADVCFVYLREDDGLRLAGVSSVDPRWAEVIRERAALHPRLGDAPVGVAAVVRTGRSELIPELTEAYTEGIFRSAADRALLEPTTPRSAMTVPLLASGRVIGALTFARIRTQARYDAADLALGEEIARRAGVAIDNARLFEQAGRDRRRAEEATRHMDDFLATVSHELRTPLTAILGWARLLAEASLPEPARPRALAAIVRGAHAQKRLIEDLLDVSRIIAGQLRIDRARVDLAAVIEAALDAARPHAEARGVVLSSSIADDAGVVLGDAERIRQIAHNLLTNAVKFTPRGGRVDASLEAHGGAAILTVADTGIGIRPDFLPFVFDRFRQADAGTTRAHGGLGLGLAIARHLAELHGGALTAHSEGEGRGSRFVLRLPLDAEPSGRRAPGGPPEGAAIPDLRGVRVLVVDDEEEMRAFLVAALRLAEAEVEVTGDAPTALARVLAAPPDVLISDIGMAEQDGYALLGAVRALPAAKGGCVPAVALTAYARESDRAAATRAGFDAHVAKPVEPAEMLALVARLCGRASA